MTYKCVTCKCALTLKIYPGFVWVRLKVSSALFSLAYSVTSKKLPNVYESCPKMISLDKLKILTTPLQKLPKYVGDLGKLIVAKDFEKLPKVQ